MDIPGQQPIQGQKEQTPISATQQEATERERFKSGLKQIMSVPKSELDRREAELQSLRQQTRQETHKRTKK